MQKVAHTLAIIAGLTLIVVIVFGVFRDTYLINELGHARWAQLNRMNALPVTWHTYWIAGIFVVGFMIPLPLALWIYIKGWGENKKKHD